MAGVVRTKKDLEAQLEALQQLAPICDAQGLGLIEAYARTQLTACVEEVYKETATDPAAHLASCQFYRGQGDTWRWISEMRTRVALEIVGVRQQLAALRKEA